MLTVGYLAAVIVGGVVLFAYYLFSLTANEAVALKRFKGRDLYARWALEGLSSPVHAPLLAHRGTCRDFTRALLADLASDWEALKLSGMRRGLGWVAFCGLYGLTWLKAKLWAGPGDLRPIIGLHLLLLR